LGTPLFVLVGGLRFLDIILVFMVYLYLSYGENTASVFAFFQGLFLNIYSGTIHGIFPFLYLLVLLFILIISNLVDIHTKLGNILCVSLALLVKYILLFLIMYLILRHEPISPSFLKELLIRFLITASLSSAIFSLLNKLRYVESS